MTSKAQATNSEHYSKPQRATSEGKFKPSKTLAYVCSNNAYLPWGNKGVTNFKIPWTGSKYH